MGHTNRCARQLVHLCVLVLSMSPFLGGAGFGVLPLNAASPAQERKARPGGKKAAPAKKASKSTRTKKPAKQARPVKPAPRWDAAAINSPVQPVIQKDDTGAPVVRAQILLDRAHFSPGEIDGKYDKVMHDAVAAFQTAHKLDGTGVVDEATWKALTRGVPAVLGEYTLTKEDVAGPFEKVPGDMMKKSELERLAYGSPLEALGERFHVAPALLKRLNPGKRLDRAGETIAVPDLGEPATGMAASVMVTAADSSVSVFDAQGSFIARYPATTGSQYDPLPLGTWAVRAIRKSPTFNYNPELFWDADPSHAKARIAPGPNNPVGLVWIQLSKQHYGIHGTPEPANIGQTQSHGCIRLTNWDAMELAALVTPGTVAILQEAFDERPPVTAREPAPARQDEKAPPAEAGKELLERGIGMPLHNVPASAILDTFNEQRGEGRRHEATDIVAPRGTPVLAVDDGEIAKLFNSKPGGLTVYQFDPSKSFVYYYAHLDRYAENLKDRQWVKRGDVIGYVGTTGNAPENTPHLHFAIMILGPEKQYWKGTPINPYPLLVGAATARR